MAKFPKREADITPLAIAMCIGYETSPEDFPRTDPVELRDARKDYRSARNAQMQAQAKLQMVTAAKNKTFKALKEIMKNYLKKSQVDVTNDPQKLALIGWGPKALLQSVAAPGQPGNLQSVATGCAAVSLKWERPPEPEGGPVRTYIIQRRQKSKTDGRFGPWELIAASYKTEIRLKDQPRRIQLEYRIKAINKAGESIPSNVIAVVL